LQKWRFPASNREIFQVANNFYQKEEFPLNESQKLIIFRDISTEIKLFQEIKARNNRLNLIESTLNGNISFGIVIFDQECNLHFVSNPAKSMLLIPQRLKLQKCYQLFKRLQQCSECFLKKKELDLSSNKRTINQNGTHVTIETIKNDNFFVYILRNTSREIQLIQQIKEQQENLKKANLKISEQNELLKQLTLVSIKIGELNDLNQILFIVINSIKEIFAVQKAALVIYPSGSKIEYAAFTDSFPENERQLILQNIFSNVNNLIDFTVFPIDENNRSIGKLFLQKNSKNVDQSIISIFLRQVAILLKNTQLQQKLEESAYRDAMTGVFNRNYFEKRFSQEIELSKKFQQPLSLIIIDLNGLKEANDLRGHRHGDALLVAAAGHLEANKGHNDTLFRIGGDEFAIICSNCSLDLLTKKIAYLKKVSRKTFYEVDNIAFFYSYSLGGACSTETDYDKIKELADQRMYDDKNEFYKTHPRYREGESK